MTVSNCFHDNIAASKPVTLGTAVLFYDKVVLINYWQV